MDQQLFYFYKGIQSIFSRLNVTPVVYGSLAYRYHTSDESMPIHDIDLLVPEESFPEIMRLLDQEKEITYELKPYHSIEVFKGGMEIDIDSIEHFLDPRSREVEKETLFGVEFCFINRGALTDIYSEALKNMPLDKKLDAKRNNYQEKLSNLRKLF